MKKRSLATITAAAALISTIVGATAQQQFKTPDEAVGALVAAVRAGDRKAITAVLGTGAEDIVSSGDAVQDENTRKIFVAAFDAKHSIDGSGPATLLIGPDDYPFAIPLVEKAGSWQFNTVAGREEVLARRIGRNELDAIQVCFAYFDAQNEYADIMPKFDGMAVYAQRFVSRPGKKDGLFWPTSAGEQQSPIGPSVAMASAHGYHVGSGEPFRGYYYKILRRQGPAAPGGELDFVVDGKMIGGFALVAWPAQYGNSGITTFIINNDGVLLEKDLGYSTSRIVSGLTWFNPDPTWKKVTVTSQAR